MKNEEWTIWCHFLGSYSLEEGFDYCLHLLCAGHGVEMEDWESCLQEGFTLAYSPLYSYFLHVSVVLTGNDFLHEFLWQIYCEGLRKYCQLRLCGKGLETWKYRNVDSGFVAFVAEADDTLGIIAYLRSDILGSSVNLLLEIAHVGEHIWRFHVLLWICGHTDAEVAVVTCVRLAVDESSCIHVHYLLYEGIGMRQAFRMWAAS